METPKRIRMILVGLKGIIQIKDDLVVQGKGEKHDRNLELFLRGSVTTI